MSADYGQTGTGPNVEFGKGGPRVKDSAGVLQFRNAADAAFVKSQCADPTVDDDIATKRYVDSVGTPGFTATKTANYTASSNEHVKYDISGPTFTITMPASPSTDDQVGIKNVTTDISAITLSGNGNNVEDPSSPGSTSASVSVTGAGVSLIYQFDGTAWWIV